MQALINIECNWGVEDRQNVGEDRVSSCHEGHSTCELCGVQELGP